MMHKITEASLFYLAVMVAQSFAVLPDNYRSLSAKAKQDLQWNQIVATKYDWNNLPTSFPTPGSNVSLLTIPEYLRTTFTNYGDEMPGNRRRMVIAPYALVCKVILQTYKNSTSQFTGLFNSGGIGIIRLALDGAKTLKDVSNFDVSTVTKIYVDGDWSQNLEAIRDLDGQGDDKDYFRFNMSNIIDTKLFDNNNPVVKAFIATVPILPGDALARPVDSGNLPTYEFASVNSNGTKVTEVVAPWEAILQPIPANRISPYSFSRDFRLNLKDIAKPGTVLYTVLGRRTINSAAELIGKIVVDGECLASDYSDQQLFFRHPSLQWRL